MMISGVSWSRRALAACAILFVGLVPSTASAQIRARAGAFLGAYDVGAGSHPFVHLAVGGRMGMSLVGPLSFEIEAVHVPAKIGRRSVDLFAYRGALALDARSGDIRPFFLLGTGFHQWRTWLCEATSCGEPRGPGRRFAYVKGLGYTVGGGARFHATGPMWFRFDARFEKSTFEAPTNDDWLATLGAEFQP